MENTETRESKYSNSPIGSIHWHNTIIGKVLRIGEYMQDHGKNEPRDGIYSEWGKEIYGIMQEMLEWKVIEKKHDTQGAIEILENYLIGLKRTLPHIS